MFRLWGPNTASKVSPPLNYSDPIKTNLLIITPAVMLPLSLILPYKKPKKSFLPDSEVKVKAKKALIPQLDPS